MPARSGKGSRDKGARAERQVVAWLVNNGFANAERRGGGFESSDIIGYPSISFEVKDHSAIRLRDFFNQMAARKLADKADIGILICKRGGHRNPGEWYAVMTLDQAARLMRSAGYGSPLDDKD